jgi:ABC-type uncharacterized transport system substrate-binding protein
MNRRAVILLAGGAAAWPLAARAQQAAKLPVVGFLGANSPSAQNQFNAAFENRLRELGWMDGRTVRIEYRWAEGRASRYSEIAAEFVSRKVDVIVTAGSGAFAVKRATSVIPVVFIAAADPVSSGIVKSLARPGGNITGLSQQSSDLVGKRLELLREVVPGLSRLAILANLGNPGLKVETAEVQEAARTLGLDVATLEIHSASDIVPALQALQGHADGLYVCGDPLITSNRVRINTLTLSARLPAIFNFREHVEAGGLISYGPDFSDVFRRAAEYLDKILRGAKPGDLPVEQPTKFNLVINVLTAKVLGLTVPPMLLARADEVIE